MSKSVAIVTDASQGIGKATAVRLACDFSALVLVARNRANLDETAKAVDAAGAKALIVDIDLARPEAVQAVVGRTLAAFGRTDALLNISGAVPQVDLLEMIDAQWENGLALELHGARRLTIAAWPAQFFGSGYRFVAAPPPARLALLIAGSLIMVWSAIRRIATARSRNGSIGIGNEGGRPPRRWPCYRRRRIRWGAAPALRA